MQQKIGVIVMVVMLALAGVVMPEANAQSDEGADQEPERTYYTYVPTSYDGAEAVPLVIALHPFASSGRAMAAMTGFDAMAEEEGFIVVYPDALDLDWNDAQNTTGWETPLQLVDDVGFVTGLIDELAAEYNIDTGQVFLTGFGVGGMMAYRLACEAPDRFAKVAVVGTSMWDYHLSACPDEGDPVSMLILMGGDSLEYPPSGRTTTRDTADGQVVLQALNAYQIALYWAGRNECDREDTNRDNLAGDQVYTSCADDTSVMLRVLDGVGTNWPRTGDYTLNQFGVDATEIVTEYFVGDVEEANFDSHRVQGNEGFGGVPRGYILYVPPSYDPAVPMPLVVALHGRPGTAAGLAYLFDLNKLAAEEGFMVLYPDGMPVLPDQLGREWNYTLGAPGYEYHTVDDVGFLSTLIDDLALDLNIDRQRIYVTGFSNGGFMTQRLACDAYDQYAAFAVVGATLFPYFVEACFGAPPVPIMFIHGTADPSVPWEGTVMSGEVLSWSAPETVLFWAVNQNECAADQVVDTVLPPDPVSNTQVFRYDFGGCSGHSDVIFYVIEGGGHNLPGVPDRLDPEIAQLVNTDIVAGEVIWEFFDEFSLEAPEADAPSASEPQVASE
ncbi:MAG: hypothetical protein GYB65_04810 [Chloroflexi bacterium]|nr:hypothetical protein [Chloroflexota bacterium]